MCAPFPVLVEPESLKVDMVSQVKEIRLVNEA